MPWCEGCDRFMNPNTLRADGTCPTCHREVAEPSRPPTAVVDDEERAEVQVNLVPDLPASATDVPKAPWHFKLLVVAAVIYIVWRVVQMVGWVVA